MSSQVPETLEQGQHSDRGGLIAVGTGFFIAVGAFILSTACCWAPALILSLGLGTTFAAFLGARWYIIAAGVVLSLGGLAWHLLRRRRDACGCARP